MTDGFIPGIMKIFFIFLCVIGNNTYRHSVVLYNTDNRRVMKMISNRQLTHTERILNEHLYKGKLNVDIIDEFQAKYGSLQKFVCDGIHEDTVPCPVHHPIDYVLWVYDADEQDICECDSEPSFCSVHAIRDIGNANFYLFNIEAVRMRKGELDELSTIILRG